MFEAYPAPTSFSISSSSQPVKADLRLLLLCHAEEMHTRYSSLMNKDGGLTAAGWRQTEALGHWLKSHYAIDLLISTPQLRNRLTAQRLGQILGLPVTVHQGLPVLDGELDTERGDVAQIVSALFEPGSGEGAASDGNGEFCRRLNLVVAQLLQTHGGETVALVMSGPSISATLGCLFTARTLDVMVDHASVSELEFSGGRWHVICINRREHRPLPPLASLAEESAPAPAPQPEDLSTVTRIYNTLAGEVTHEGEAITRSQIRDLIRFAHLQPDLQILDTGSGFGLLTMALAEAGAAEVVGIDISPAMLERAEYRRLSGSAETAARVDFRLAAAQMLPFRNDRFDCAFCRHLLHLNRKPEAILRELHRVLRPGGLLIVAEPLGADDPVKRATYNAIEERRNPAHVAVRAAQGLRDLLQGARFKPMAEETASFDRDLESWLVEYAADGATAAFVREMIAAALETDAAGINVRRQGDTYVFSQRLIYLKAVKTG